MYMHYLLQYKFMHVAPSRFWTLTVLMGVAVDGVGTSRGMKEVWKEVRYRYL